VRIYSGFIFIFVFLFFLLSGRERKLIYIKRGRGEWMDAWMHGE
jgi:hypothetical protein